MKRGPGIAWWLALVSLQLALATVPTWLRAHAFSFSNYDFGIYSQALARLALAPPNPWLSGRQLFLFNDHFDPVLFLAAPFARVFPAAEVGLVVEALSAVLALVPLAWLVREERVTPRGAWVLGGLLAASIGVTQALAFPFHPTTWAMAPLAWLLAALLLERWKTALVALVLLLSCKEEFPFVGVMLTPYVFLRARRGVAWAFGGLSVAWGVFALVLRPRLLGEVMPYGSLPFRGLAEGPAAFFGERLAVGVLHGAADLFVAFLPLVGWLAWSWWRGARPARVTWWLFAPLVPLLGIRFLAMAWREHYGAVVVAALVFALAALLERREVPAWVLISTLALVGVTNETLIRREVKVLSGRAGWGFSAGCDDVRGRRESIARALEVARGAPGPLFVSGNLLPWLAFRDDVYAFGGPQPDTLVPATVLLERPPCGDTWGQSREAREATVKAWEGRQVLISDEFVLLAKGGEGR